MTIEQKASAYDEAIERAKDFMNGEVHYELKIGENIMCWVFPELRESEDERIRKEIIELVKFYYGSSLARKQTVSKDEMVAWLEKQYSDPNWCHHKVDLSDCSEEYIKAYYDGWNNCNQQHSQCETESNDVVKCLINGMRFYYDGNEEATWGTEKFSMKVKDILSWLEKQGEQKPTDKIKPKFKVEKDKWYVCTSQYCNCIEGRNYKASLDGRIIDDYGTEYDIHSDAYRWFRPWTVQDAKDGDVLTCYSDIKGQPIEQTGIIKQYIGRHGGCSNSFKAYFGVDWDGKAVIDGFMGSTNIFPATKEQRDTLMKAMADAGYTFDFEKKELKEIEQLKLTKFEDAIKDMMNDYRDAIGDNDATVEDVKKHAAYLLSLIPCKPAEWSEEDEHRVEDIIYFLDTAKKHYASTLELDACIDWAKSLKQRIGE